MTIVKLNIKAKIANPTVSVDKTEIVNPTKPIIGSTFKPVIAYEDEDEENINEDEENINKEIPPPKPTISLKAKPKIIAKSKLITPQNPFELRQEINKDTQSDLAIAKT